MFIGLTQGANISLQKLIKKSQTIAVSLTVSIS